MAFFSQVSLLLALISVIQPHVHGAECNGNAALCAIVEDETNFIQVAHKIQLAPERTEMGNRIGARVFYGVAFKPNLSAALSPDHICASNKPDKDNDACVKEALKDDPNAKEAGGISNCAQLAKAEWCTTPTETHSDMFGNWCPVSCHWNKCEDHDAQFKEECEGKEDCSKAPHETCKWAVSDGWCDSKSKAGQDSDGKPAELGASTAHWMHWICRKSCCKETGGKHHTCGKVCKESGAKKEEKTDEKKQETKKKKKTGKSRGKKSKKLNKKKTERKKGKKTKK